MEDFRVQLLGKDVTAIEAEAVIRSLPHIWPDPEGGFMPDCHYFLVADGQHTIELELTPQPLGISCRFTLCHPPTVDEVFLELVRSLQRQLPLEVLLCEARDDKHAGPFAVDRFAEFAALTRRYIADRRRDWIAQFGPEMCGGSRNEVFQRIILPRLRPVTSREAETNHSAR